MDINYFDIGVSAIILLLGLKGIINGFFKEVFGLIGIVGGIFVASRFGEKVGTYLSDMVFKFQSDAAINFTGFLVTLLAFWVVMVVIGFLFKKLSSASGLGPIDRFFGFLVGSGKFFLIAAVIAFAISNVKALQSTVESVMKTSVLFPVLVETGGYIMKMDPTQITHDINQTVSQKAQEAQTQITQKVEDAVKESAQEKIEAITQETQNH